MSRPDYWVPFANANFYLPQSVDFTILKLMKDSIPLINVAVEKLDMLMAT